MKKSKKTSKLLDLERDLPTTLEDIDVIIVVDVQYLEKLLGREDGKNRL